MRWHPFLPITRSNQDVVHSTKNYFEMEKIPEDISVKFIELSKRLSANPNDEATLIERGRLHWSLGHRSEAINDYLAAQKLNPEGKAKELLKATYEILNFYHKDLYNP